MPPAVPPAAGLAAPRDHRGSPPFSRPLTNGRFDVIMELSDRWIEKYRHYYTREVCQKSYLRSAYFYTDTVTILCGRFTRPACGKKHMGHNIIDAQKKRECILRDFSSRLPKDYPNKWILSTEQDTVFNERLLHVLLRTKVPEYPAYLPILHPIAEIYVIGPFFLANTATFKYFFQNGGRFDICKRQFLQCYNAPRPRGRECAFDGRYSEKPDEYNNDHLLTYCMNWANISKMGRAPSKSNITTPRGWHVMDEKTPGIVIKFNKFRRNYSSTHRPRIPSNTMCIHHALPNVTWSTDYSHAAVQMTRIGPQVWVDYTPL